jgi:hypothetical protein
VLITDALNRPSRFSGPVHKLWRRSNSGHLWITEPLRISYCVQLPSTQHRNQEEPLRFPLRHVPRTSLIAVSCVPTFESRPLSTPSETLVLR